MQGDKQKIVIVLKCFFKFSVFLLTFVFFIPYSFSAEWQKNNVKLNGQAQQIPSGDDDDGNRKYFTDLKLITQEGKEVSFYTDLLKDKVVLIHFFYTNCPDVCPMQNEALASIQQILDDKLGKDIFIISITVDPDRDTPAVVKEYAQLFGATKGRIFLTGEKDNVSWINYKLGGYSEAPENHSTVFLLGNVKTGHWMKLKPDTTAKILAENLLKLLEEKRIDKKENK